MPTPPVVAVGAVIFDHAGSVLMVRRGQPPLDGSWSLPGGKLQRGETLEVAVRREILEETGLMLADIALLDVADYIERDATGAVTHHYALVDYWAKLDAMQVPRAGGDVTDACFMPLARALALPLWSETARMIALGAERAGFSHILPAEAIA